MKVEEVIAKYENIEYFEIVTCFLEIRKAEDFEEKKQNNDCNIIALWMQMTQDYSFWNFREYNGIKDINQYGDFVVFLRNKIKNTKSDIFKFRYYDLLYNFSEKDKNYCVEWMYKCWLNIINKNVWNFVVTIIDYYIPRIINTLYTTSKKEYLDNAISVFINYENSISNDLKPWTRWFIFNYILWEYKVNKKIHIKEKTKKALLAWIIERLERLVKSESKELQKFYSIESCIEKLLSYYKWSRNENDIKELLYLYEREYRKHADNKINKYWIEKILWKYRYMNMKPRDDLMIEMKELAKNTDDIAWQPIENDPLGRWLNHELINNCFSEDNKLIINKFIRNFLISKNYIEKLNEKTKWKSLFYYIWWGTILEDEDNIPYLKIPPYRENPDLYKYQTWQFVIMDEIPEIKAVCGRIRKYNVWNLFINWNIEEVLWISWVDRLWSYFLNRNYIEFISNWLIIVEPVLRNLLIKLWWNDLTRNEESGWYDRKILRQLLGEYLIVEYLWDDIIFYLRLLLTEKAWFNRRNCYCHWRLLKSFELQPWIADRIFHLLVLLDKIYVEF